MSALLKDSPIPSRRPHLSVVPPVPSKDERVSVSPMTYRRRRLLALALSVLAVFTIWYLGNGLFAFLAGEGAEPMQTISSSHPLAEDVPDEAQYVTVRPGDTLWSIAQEVQPKGDIRPVLNRLASRYGTTPLVPGQNINVS